MTNGALKNVFLCLNKYHDSLLRNFKYYQVFSRHNTRASSEVSAGILIIGDEILRGSTEDANTGFFIKSLNSENVRIKKICLIPDDVDVISKEVAELSDKCSFVLTSGGIGPTHDDVTYEAVAKAFGEDLQLNEELSGLFTNYFGPESNRNPAIIKFASIPQSAVLNFSNIVYNGRNLKFPLVSMRNVYMFPGVPMLLQKSFENFKSKIIPHSNQYFTRNIFIAVDEFIVTPLLNEAVQKFNSHVKFGSYPTFSDNYYKVKLILESSSKQWVEKAYDFLRENLPKGSIVEFISDILLNAENDVYTLSKCSQSVSTAVSVLEQALKKYDLSEMCLCFNGGKDCTALLHMLYACAKRTKPHDWSKLHAFYVKNGESFNEIEVFINAVAKRYDLNFVIFEGDLKTATSEFLRRYPEVKAVLMGIRKCDPGAASMEYFCQTDADWPSVMRILPLLNWTYHDIWSFIRNLQLPYCLLYDRGYTSLGNKSETVKNPSLLYVSQTGRQLYKPAYELENADNERSSRV